MVTQMTMFTQALGDDGDGTPPNLNTWVFWIVTIVINLAAAGETSSFTSPSSPGPSPRDAADEPRGAATLLGFVIEPQTSDVLLPILPELRTDEPRVEFVGRAFAELR